MHLSNNDAINVVCAVLSNPNRLALLQEAIDSNGQTHPELHQAIESQSTLTHRETSHSYLKDLVDAGLLEKKTDSDGTVTYHAVTESIELLLAP